MGRDSAVVFVIRKLRANEFIHDAKYRNLDCIQHCWKEHHRRTGARLFEDVFVRKYSNDGAKEADQHRGREKEAGARP